MTLKDSVLFFAHAVRHHSKAFLKSKPRNLLTSQMITSLLFILHQVVLQEVFHSVTLLIAMRSPRSIAILDMGCFHHISQCFFKVFERVSLWSFRVSTPFSLLCLKLLTHFYKNANVRPNMLNYLNTTFTFAKQLKTIS